MKMKVRPQSFILIVTTLVGLATFFLNSRVINDSHNGPILSTTPKTHLISSPKVPVTSQSPALPRRHRAVPSTPRVVLPLEYPVHRQIPSPETLLQGLDGQIRRNAKSCADSRIPPLPPTPPSHPRGKAVPVDMRKLTEEFRFVDDTEGAPFLDPSSMSHETLGPDEPPWWIASTGNIPCTAEAQRALFKHQHPTSCGASKYFSTRLKANAHGLGSALSIVVYDML